jgi:NitT/TauT family transport system permease protein
VGALQRWILGGCGALLLLAAWVVASALAGSELIVPPPTRVLALLAEQLITDRFWIAVGGTVLRVLAGFSISLALSVLMGVLSGLSESARALLRPLLVTIQSVPVLAVILILLIWFGSALVPVVTAVLMTLPVMTEAVIGGVRGVDRRLLEMAALYRVAPRSVLWKIQLPAVVPPLLSGAAASLGLTWKVVIAAEILAQPVRAVGTEMQGARVILDTASVFSWTIAAVLLSGLTQALFRLAARRWSFNGHRVA